LKREKAGTGSRGQGIRGRQGRVAGQVGGSKVKGKKDEKKRQKGAVAEVQIGTGTHKGRPDHLMTASEKREEPAAK